MFSNILFGFVLFLWLFLFTNSFEFIYVARSINDSHEPSNKNKKIDQDNEEDGNSTKKLQ